MTVILTTGDTMLPLCCYGVHEHCCGGHT